MILIPNREMPEICQNCPCFNVFTGLDTIGGKQYVAQLCRATGLTIFVKLDDGQFDDKWIHTIPPDFCPLIDAKGWIPKETNK